MSAESDLHYSLGRAASAVQDAAGACRTARRGSIPARQRELITAATRKLEWAQDDLWKASNEPWTTQPKPKHKQLTLV